MATKKLSEQRARAVARELLGFRGWNVRSVEKGGQLLEEAEYKHHAPLAKLFDGKSKSGPGAGKPDFLLLQSATSLKPVLIIETKAAASDIGAAMTEAVHYATACSDAGHEALAIGVAGAEKEICSVSVKRRIGPKWHALTLNGSPIDWIPSPAQTAKILGTSAKIEVAAERPSNEVLAAQANRLNEILRECKIKDEYRPIYAATFMLGLWVGDVSIESSVVLKQVNSNAHLALQKAGKSVLANSLRVDDENDHLASRAWEIVDILKKLNIRSFLQEHDYLGQLYETFFRYTGGNTIGQYFTPRHVIEFMCELVDIRPTDKVFDPACGTGGFLIGALNRMTKKKKLPYEEAVKLVKDNLFGIESEPATAALCITNMILRGDGKSGILKDNCFSNLSYPGEVDCALMNPPFPHKKTDTPTTNFIDRALASVKKRGHLATIVPYSLLVNTREWHQQILRKHSLVFVATLPADLFNPYASFNTAILVLQKGIPHEGKPVYFARISNDGFKLKKNTRVPQAGSQLPKLLLNFAKKINTAEFCAVEAVDETSAEWSPEAFIQNAAHVDEEFIKGLEESIRDQASFYVRFGHRLLPPAVTSRLGVADALAGFASYSAVKLAGLTMKPFLIGDYFSIELGGSAEIEDLEEGVRPIVSTSEFMNGVSTWRSPPRLYGPSCITVATDGSTCSSFVQEFPFYAFYKVAILKPKFGVTVPIDALYYVAYLLRRERWRYVYARKFGKSRISQTKVFAPSKAGSPDFKKMAQIVRTAAAYPIVESFRAAYADALAKVTVAGK